MFAQQYRRKSNVQGKKLSHLIKFYEYFGFKQIQPQSLTMYLKLGDIATVN